MKSGPSLSIVALVLLALISAAAAFAQPQGEPTSQEIEEAYRSKTGESDFVIPHIRWEHWRIKQIRGWSLHFKALSETRRVGILTRKYSVIAKKNGCCAQYAITDTVPLPPNNVQIRPTLVIERTSLTTCR